MFIIQSINSINSAGSSKRMITHLNSPKFTWWKFLEFSMCNRLLLEYESWIWVFIHRSFFFLIKNVVIGFNLDLGYFFFKIHEIVTLYLFPSGNRFFLHYTTSMWPIIFGNHHHDGMSLSESWHFFNWPTNFVTTFFLT